MDNVFFIKVLFIDGKQQGKGYKKKFESNRIEVENEFIEGHF